MEAVYVLCTEIDPLRDQGSCYCAIIIIMIILLSLLLLLIVDVIDC